MGKKRLRVVLDTNVILSALLFGGRLEFIRKAWKGRKLRPVFSEETLEELVKVLHYPKFALEDEEIDFLIYIEVMPYAEVVERVIPNLDTPGQKIPLSQRFPDTRPSRSTTSSPSAASSTLPGTLIPSALNASYAFPSSSLLTNPLTPLSSTIYALNDIKEIRRTFRSYFGPEMLFSDLLALFDRQTFL